MGSSRWFTALALLPFLAACGSAGAADPGVTPTGSDPDGHTYVVTGVTEKGKPRALVARSQIRLRFEGDRLVVTAGCNTMSGTFQLTGSRLTVADLATTEMGCAPALMAQDTWVAGLFAEPSQLNTGDDAALISGDVVLELADRAVVSPDKPLAGTHWELDGIVEGQTASSVPEGQQGSLLIRGSQITLYDGCNHGSGTVRVLGAELTFQDIVMTVLPCPSTHAMLFQAYADVFDGTATYSITENTLTITNGDHGLTFRAR